MITRLTQVTDEDRANLDPNHWRLLVMAELGDHSRLSTMPWEQLRKLELVPGYRLNASPIVLPEEGWLPTSAYSWEHARTIDPSAVACIPNGSLEAVSRRDESIRRCMLALWLPPVGGRNRIAPSPTTWVAAVKCLLRLVASATKRHPNAEGTIFSHLSHDDISAVLLGFPEANRVRAICGHMMRRLADCGRHGILSDYPSPQVKDATAGRRGVKRLAGVVVPERKKKPVTGSWQPFPDAFVRDLMSRALWVQEHLADQVMDCWQRDAAYMAPLRAEKILNLHRRHHRERRSIITNYPWKLRDEPLTELPFDVRYADRKPTRRLPRTAIELGALFTLVQGLNIHVIAFCTAARKAEIGSATERSMPWPEGGDWRFIGRTWKLTRMGGGKVRDWPLHPVGVRALEIQRRMAGMVPRTIGKDYLWVLARQPNSANFGRRMFGLEAPAIEAAERLGLSGVAKSSRTAQRALIQKKTGDTRKLTNERAHLHRWRHTVGSLVARTVVEAPQVLFDLFGHRDHAMTLRYMVADPNIRQDAERIAREVKIVRAKRVLRECLAGEASGPAAAPLRQGLTKAIQGHGGDFESDVDDAAEAELAALGFDMGLRTKLDVLAEQVSANGATMNMVRPGVLCTKGMDEFGPCTQGRGVPDPGACRTTCSHRLEQSSAKEECRAELKALLAEFAEAKERDEVMVATNLEGQIRAHLHRWPDVREDFLRADENVPAIWSRVAA